MSVETRNKDDTKLCSDCNAIKQKIDFAIAMYNKSGYSYCKSCVKKRNVEYGHTVKGLIAKIYASQKRSSLRRKHIMPNYSKDDLYNFAMSDEHKHTFMELFNAWKASDFNRLKIPSFDRDDDYKPYSFNNFRRWCKWEDNKKRYHDDVFKGINNKKSKSIIQLDLNDNVVGMYASQRAASRATGISQAHIANVCSNKTLIDSKGFNYTPVTAGGFKWIFNNNNITIIINK